MKSRTPETAVMTGLLGAIGGGLMYGLAGGKTTIKINGDKEIYYKRHQDLKKHLLVR